METKTITLRAYKVYSIFKEIEVPVDATDDDIQELYYEADINNFEEDSFPEYEYGGYDEEE